MKNTTIKDQPFNLFAGEDPPPVPAFKEKNLEANLQVLINTVQEIHVPWTILADLCEEISSSPSVEAGIAARLANLKDTAGKLNRLIQKMYDSSGQLSMVCDATKRQGNPQSLCGGQENGPSTFQQTVQHIIDGNISNAMLCPSFLAEKLNISLRSLYRKLEEAGSCNPAELIRKCRFLRAQHLLLTTDLTVEEIVYQSGFCNKSGFFKFFRNRFGCTPKAFRRRKNAAGSLTLLQN